jgi:acyl-CoA thioesterase
MSMSPQEIAQKSADEMWRDDRATAGLGMKIESVATGEATITMPVRRDMTNGHGVCHGGFIFTLADSAFDFACNSYNRRCVAQHCMVSFLAPAKEGMILRAHAKERQREGRGGIYDVSVSDETGLLIAEFRGWSRTIPGTFF